jgi:hypothetical protein
VPALHSPLIYSGKGWLWCSALPFTTVEDNPHIAPVLKVSTQLFVPFQTAAGHYEEEQCQAPIGWIMTGLTAYLSFFGGCVYPYSFSPPLSF